MPSASRARRAEIILGLEKFNCKIKLVPGMADIVNGMVTADAVREVEIDDLLGREAVAPEQNLLGKCVMGKVVLVSGAGGSIGSELCRQIIRLRPRAPGSDGIVGICPVFHRAGIDVAVRADEC